MLLRAVSVMPSSDLVVCVIIPSVTAVAISLTCAEMETHSVWISIIKALLVLNKHFFDTRKNYRNESQAANIFDVGSPEQRHQSYIPVFGDERRISLTSHPRICDAPTHTLNRECCNQVYTYIVEFDLRCSSQCGNCP